MDNATPKTSEGALLQLRALAPRGRLTLPEAMRAAERQAAALRALTAAHDALLPLSVIADQPRIVLEYDTAMPLSVSGASDWDYGRRCWVITVNAEQPPTRQRFTALHEYKHILDHGQPPLQVSTRRRFYGLPAAEFVADYFAGCALVPSDLLEQAWHAGLHHLGQLARYFGVSERAIEVRLQQLDRRLRSGRCVSTLLERGAA